MPVLKNNSNPRHFLQVRIVLLMYSGWWMLISGISLMWHNIFLISVIFINWGIMTVVLKATEEKWLSDLYGQEYEDYCKRVNRCIPWKRN